MWNPVYSPGTLSTARAVSLFLLPRGGEKVADNGRNAMAFFHDDLQVLLHGVILDLFADQVSVVDHLSGCFSLSWRPWPMLFSPILRRADPSPSLYQYSYD